MQTNKETLRDKLRTRRRALGADKAADLSNRIIRNTAGVIDWSSVTSVHVYQPISQQRETDTTPLFHMIWRQYPWIQMATWQRTPDGYEAVWIDSDGPMDPVHARQQFSVIVVPVLGFNSARHRIGFGGGFYDRFLATQPGAVTIGLCYAFGYTAAFRPEAHDIPLTHIVTEERII